MTSSTLTDILLKEADELYCGFMLPLLPGLNQKLLGVRMPRLRELAKSAVKSDWRTLWEELPHLYYEQVIIKGLIVGYAAMDWSERLTYVRKFVKEIDNWGVCDSFVSSLKAFQQHTDEGWTFLMPYAQSDAPYEQRFAAVMLLWYYLTPERIPEVLRILSGIKALKYYARMGVAWAVCECFLVDADTTYPWLNETYFSKEILRMIRKKILESLRTSEQWRTIIKEQL